MSVHNLVPSSPSCVFFCPKGQTPSSTSGLCCSGMIGRRESVVSGKVWAEEQCLLVERILVNQGMWCQEAPGIKGL